MPILNTPTFLFHNALDFFSIGKQKTEEIFKTPPLENPHLWLHISAPAVNLAFALELMLKAIILAEKKRMDREDKQHKLKILFHRISVNAREAIISDFALNNKDKTKYPTLRFAKEEYAGENRGKTTAPKPSEQIIDELLSDHDESFVDWRYSYELSEIESKKEMMEFNFGYMIRLIETTSGYLKKVLTEGENKS